MHFFETSAKQDTNVEKAFISLAEEVIERLIEQGSGGMNSGGSKLTAGAPKPKANCC